MGEEGQLARQIEVQRTVARITKRFMSSLDLDTVTDESLADLGRLIDAARTELWTFSPDFLSASVTHQWCAEGVASTIDVHQSEPLAGHKRIIGQWKDGKTTYIPDLKLLPPEDAAMRKLLERSGQTSFIAAPVLVGRKLSGVVAASSIEPRSWAVDEATLFRVCADFIGYARHYQKTTTELEERLRFEELLTELSSRFVNLPADEVDTEIERQLGRLAEHMLLDRIVLFQLKPSDSEDLVITHTHGVNDVPMDQLPSAAKEVPWGNRQVLAGRSIIVSSLEDLPAEAAQDKKTLGARGVKSMCALPLEAGGAVVGLILFSTIHEEREWPDEVVQRLQLVAGVLAGALDRTQTEKDLHQEKSFIDTALDAQMDTFFLFDPATGKALRWNRAFRDISGYSDEEIADLPAPASYYSPQDLERAAPFVQQAMEEGTGTIELDLICKDGRRVPTEYRVGVIRDDEGKPKHMISTGRDVTERRRMEEQLRKTQLHYTDFINSSSDLVSYWRVAEGLKVDLPVEQQVEMLYESVCLDANRAFWENFDLDEKAAIVGKRFVDLFPRRKSDRVFRQFVENGYRVDKLEFYAELQDGRSIYGLDSVSGSVENGELTHIWVGSIDITERIQAEEERKVYGERFRSLMEHTNEGFYLFETAEPVSVDMPLEEQIRRIYRGSMVECNEAQARMYGFDKAEEVLGKPLSYFHGGTDNPENIAFLTAWIKAGYNITGAISEELDREGNTKWFSNNVVGVVEEGALVRIWGTQTDVSEAKRAEQALLKEKAFTDLALDGQMDTFFLFDPATGRALRWNRAFRDISGYSDEEIADLPAPASYYNPEDLERAGPFLQQALEEGTGTIELDLICKDGRRVPTEYRVGVIRDDRGEPKHMISIGRDVTERRRMEEQLRRTQLHYTDFINSSSDHVSYWQMPDGLKVDLPVEEQIERLYESVCIDANRAFWELFDFHDRTEIVGKRFIELYPTRKSDGIFRQLIESGYRINDLEFHEVLQDGRSTWGLENWYGSIEDGRLTHIWASAKDITERKLAENELRRSEARYLDLYNSAIDGVVSVDLEGRILECNEAYTSMLGYSAGELLGKSFWELTPEEHHEAERKILDELLDSGMSSTASYQKEYVRRDGTVFPIELVAYLLTDTDGKPTGMWAIVRDITERRIAESALQRSERLLSRAQEMAHLGHWRLEPDSGVVEGSEELFRIFGLTREEATLEAFGSVVHPDDRAFDLGAIQKGIDQGEPWDIEHRLITKDGIEKWVRAIGDPVLDEAGKTQHIVGTVQDITERKRAETALQESEERYRKLIALSPDAIVVSDTEGRMILCNEQFVRMHGLNDQGDAAGRGAMELTAPEDRERAMQNIGRVVSGEDVPNVEYTLLRADGTRFPAEVTASLIRDSEGVPQAIMAISRDITSQKQAQERLQKERDTAQMYLDVAGTIFVVLNVEGLIVLINRKGCEVLGRREEDLIGADWFETALPADIREDVWQGFRQMTAGDIEPMEFFENPIVHRAGEIRQIS